MNKIHLAFRIFLLATGITALVIRLGSLVVDTSRSINFTAFQAFVLVSFALYGAFALITLILSFLSLKKTTGSAFAGQILYVASLFVFLAVVLNLPGFFKAASADLTSASPAFVAVYTPFVFHYGKGFGDIIAGDFTHYFLALAVTLSLMLGLVAAVLLVRSAMYQKAHSGSAYTQKAATTAFSYNKKTGQVTYQKGNVVRARTSSVSQRDIFDSSNNFFSHHTEDDIF